MRAAARIMFAVGVLAVILAVGAWARAQATPRTTPTVISGNDLGLRIERWNGNTPIGSLVVKVDGQWVAVDWATAVKRITQ